MSDIPQKPPTLALRRVSLDSLPTEVKAHIARLCAEQYATLKEKLDQLTDVRDAVTHFRKANTMTSLGSLFRSSKEWATICAPFRFTKLDLAGLRAPIFRMRLARLRGEHFTEVDLRDAPLNDLIVFVGALPLLTNLRTVHVSDFRSAAVNRDAYALLKVDDVERAYMVSAMKALLSRAHRISLDNVSPSVVSAILAPDVLARIQNLQLVFSNCVGLRSIDKLLSNLGALKRLDIRFPHDIAQLDAELSLRPARQPGDTFPALRSLRLVAPDIAPSVLQFASQFAPSLEDLELRFEYYDAEFEPQDPAGINGLIGPFPLLKKLTLEGNRDALDGPLASTDDTTMPALCEILFKPSRLFSEGVRRDQEPVLPDLGRDSPLDLMTIHPSYGSLEGLAGSEFSQIATRELRTSDNFYSATLAYSRSTAVQTQDVEFDDVEAAVSSTIEFLSGWLERATIYKDTASLVKMARALCQVELERIAYEA